MEHPPAFELKGSSLPLLVVRLLDPDLEALRAQLQARIEQAPALFAGAPLAIDLAALDHAAPAPDLRAVVEVLRGLGLTPIGVRCADPVRRQQALDAGLGVLAPGRVQPAPPGQEETPAQARRAASGSWRAAPAAAGGEAPRIVVQHVRSGQRVAAPGTDLIVVGSVSSGAEILAGRHIHVYGALRGRALAGAEGDTSAAIFCLQFNPDLVAIAGEYLVNEELGADWLGRAVHVYLQDGSLRIRPLGDCTLA